LKGKLKRNKEPTLMERDNDSFAERINTSLTAIFAEKSLFCGVKVVFLPHTLRW
jgi:hypothetical protein